MTRLLYGLGRFCVRHRWLVVAIWLIAMVTVAGLAKTLGSKTSDNYTLPGTGAQQASDVLSRLFPSQKNGSSPIVFHARTGVLNEGAGKQAVQDAFDAIENAPHVQDALNPFSHAGKILGLVSEDGTTAYIPVILDKKPGDLSIPEAQAVVDAASAPAESEGIQVAAGGIIGSVLSQFDPGGADRYGLVAAMIILAVVFGSIVAMGLPIITALFGLSIGLAVITLLSHSMDIPTVAPTMATMIGLGVGIDYALFTVTRHRDHLRDGMAVGESIARATATSGGAIVFAGGTVLIAIASLGLAGIPLVSRLGMTTSIVVAIAVLAAITLLPSALAIVGGHIDSLRMPRFLRARQTDPLAGTWARWADWVGRHPWTSVAAALLILAPLTLPLFSLELGSPDVASEPTSYTSRIAYDLLDRGFGPGYNGQLLVAVELATPASASEAFLADKARAKDLGRKLKGAAAYGERIKDRLGAKGESLKRQGEALAAEAAPLQATTQDLQREGAALLRERAMLEREGAVLLQKKTTLERKGALLQSHGKRLGSSLDKIMKEIATVQKEIAATSDPTELAHLQAQLAQLQKDAASVQAELSRLQHMGEKLKAQGEKLALQGARLQTQGERLALQGARLESRGATAKEQGASLLAAKTRLEHAGVNLKSEAHRAKEHGKVLKARAHAWLGEVKSLKHSLIQQMKDAGGEKMGTDPRLVELREALAATRGVVDVSPIQVPDSGRAAIITVTPTTDPSDPRTSALVAEMRDRVIPRATTDHGTRAYVGGLTAAYDDLTTKISGRLVTVIATVIALSFLLLMLAFRSIAIPVKAAIMNILSVAAAYGVLVAVFQWGWGLRYIGIPQAAHVPIVSFVPLMMFAVLFGLSMDYEVFLMSQIAEQHALGESNHDSVVHGLASSARVITAAALIMVAVFASFILNENPVIKQFGIGLSVAVALDATIIRILLVPATMTLLGNGNWWLPRWLSRLLPRLELEGKNYFRRTDGTAGAEVDPTPTPE